MVLTPTHSPPYAAPNLAALDPAEFDIAVAFYASAYAAGLARGRAGAEADMQARWSAVAAHIRRMANSPTHAELERRRAT